MRGRPSGPVTSVVDGVAEVGAGDGLDELGEHPVGGRRVVLVARAGLPVQPPRRHALLARWRGRDQWAGPIGAVGKPDVWSITCSSVMASLPLAPNAGNHVVTGCAGSRSPAAISRQTVAATNGLVAENRQNRVSGPASPNDPLLDDLAVEREGELGGRQQALVDVALDAGGELVDGGAVQVSGQRHGAEANDALGIVRITRRLRRLLLGWCRPSESISPPPRSEARIRDPCHSTSRRGRGSAPSKRCSTTRTTTSSAPSSRTSATRPFRTAIGDFCDLDSCSTGTPTSRRPKRAAGRHLRPLVRRRGLGAARQLRHMARGPGERVASHLIPSRR